MVDTHKDKYDDLNKKLEQESRTEEQKVVSDWEREREKLLREKKTRQAAEIAARSDLSEDQMAAVREPLHYSLM